MFRWNEAEKLIEDKEEYSMFKFHYVQMEPFGYFAFICSFT